MEWGINWVEQEIHVYGEIDWMTGQFRNITMFYSNETEFDEEKVNAIMRNREFRAGLRDALEKLGDSPE